MKNKQINSFSIDHIVINVNDYYQKNQNFIKKVNALGLPYTPKKGKGTKGFQASNFWIGKEYLELIHIKSNDGGGWRKEWVDKYLLGHRGVIGLFLKTDDIEYVTKTCKKQDLSHPERVNFPLFFNLIKFHSKWRNSYFPFFKRVPFQLGFQQIDNKKIEKRFFTQMSPNSKDRGVKGITSIKFYGPFESSDFDWVKQAFVCIEKDKKNLEIPLLHGQSIHFCCATEVRTEIRLSGSPAHSFKIEIENVTILSENQNNL